MMYKIKSSLIAVVLFLSTLGYSQAQNDFVPRMKISGGLKDTEVPVKITDMNVQIRICGSIAITTCEMNFYNPNQRILEGEFEFPLGPSQSVTGFALQNGNEWMPAAVVEKNEARKTFEAVVRRNVDPALLEMNSANSYKARIYPLNPNGRKSIRIVFEEELKIFDSKMNYQLPLKFDYALASFKARVEVLAHDKVEVLNNELTGFSFEKWNNALVSSIEKTDFKPEKALAFVLPVKENQTRVFVKPLNEKRDSLYFYVNTVPHLVTKERKCSQSLTIFWDCSASGENRDLKKEYLFLDAYFAHLQFASVNLIPFSLKELPSKSFEIKDGNWSLLKAALENMQYEGATSFEKLDLNKTKAEEILLFSDGISNWGEDRYLNSPVPLFAVGSTASANQVYLKYISETNNGQYIDLTGLTIEDAIKKLSSRPYRLLWVDIVGKGISNVFPSKGTLVDGNFGLSGILSGTDSIITLNFGVEGEVLYSEKINLKKNAIETDFPIDRIWVQKKIAELLPLKEKYKKDIIALGKKYGIITPYTSMLVLESIEDYVQYRIEPPASMLDDYRKKIRQLDDEKAETEKSHLDQVAAMFGERVKWWNAPPAKPDYNKNQDVRGSRAADRAYLTDSVRVGDGQVNNAPPVIRDDEDVMEISSNVVAEEHSFSYEERGFSAGKAKKEAGQSKGAIALNAWNPETPYYKVLEYAAKGQEFETYRKLKKEYGTMPAFYFDASGFFAEKGLKDTALLILSNLSELKIDDVQLLRVLGRKLLSYGFKAEALNVFRKVLELKVEEPQCYLDLGDAYSALGNYQDAVDSYYEVVKHKWDDRFNEVELVALMEINAIVSNHKADLKLSDIDKRLIESLPLDMRIVLDWDTDNCDMDLWVTDPNKEKCFYSHNRTQINGMISRDITQGYGPEEFLLKKAIDGEFLVQANYYGTRQQTLKNPVTLRLRCYTHFGTPQQEMKEVMLRLSQAKEVVDIGKFLFKN